MVTKEKEFLIPVNAFPGIENLKIGNIFEALINYQIIEVTKSYTMIRIKYMNPDYGKRKF